ncbi:hypothetical protein OPV22_014465 [Ensete ventricosum]|uniref:Uncharacterized protein n=1 Tax=Ensete ventricosum TaxID=4639 RepID=A0AAV8PJV3_ENSVE|nr:hypothetical protein OPV22_014465 [Ensete ventricosum]
MMYLSFSNSDSYADALASITQTQQNHNELPVTTTIISQGMAAGNSNVVTSHFGDHAHNTSKDGRNEMLFMHLVEGSINGADVLTHSDDPQLKPGTVGPLRQESFRNKNRSQSLYASAGAMTNKDASTGSKSEMMASNLQEAAANSSSELSASEKQDLQNKVSNLLGMLDEDN